MTKLRFEKVSDINFTYPYIEVFLAELNFLFLEIGVTDEKELQFTFYSSQKDIVLSWEEWNSIHLKATLFLQETLRNEKDYEDLSRKGE